MSDPDFFSGVFDVVRLIPAGRVSSYGAIARYLGSPQAARMVGWALNQSGSQKMFVPAHRVVNRNGLLTGRRYFGYADTMKELLESEGVRVEDNRVADFDRLFWDPRKELADPE